MGVHDGPEYAGPSSLLFFDIQRLLYTVIAYAACEVLLTIVAVLSMCPALLSVEEVAMEGIVLRRGQRLHVFITYPGIAEKGFDGRSRLSGDESGAGLPPKLRQTESTPLLQLDRRLIVQLA
jgi:hypothetical protein